MPYIFYFFPLIFAGLFVVVMFILFLVGWRFLSSKYAHKEPFEGKELGIGSGRIRLVNYNNMLHFKSNTDGLYIKPMAFFSLFHPPILIPWSAFHSVHKRSFIGFKYTSLIIEKPKVGSFRLGIKSFDEITSHIH